MTTRKIPLSHSDYWCLQAQEARLAAQRIEDPEAMADLLAKANEYDYLAACNKGKEFEIPSATMLIGGAAVRRH